MWNIGGIYSFAFVFFKVPLFWKAFNLNYVKVSILTTMEVVNVENPIIELLIVAQII
jgi:hypothetical protein